MGKMKGQSVKRSILISALALVVLVLVGGCGFLQKKGLELTNWEPVLSPDGTRIAFESPGEKGFEIYVCDLESGTTTQLTQNEADDWAPSWSPQGDRLVFSSSHEKNVDLYIMVLETLTVNRLTTHEGDDVNPFWGTNGKILFNSNRSGAWEIYMIAPDGTGLTKITETAESS